MRVAHLVIVTPGRCGLYETTRELAHGLRAIGHDARLVETGANKVYAGGYPEAEDRGVPVASIDWAMQADVLVNHSGYDGTNLAKTNQPIIHVAHGRPRSSFLTERDGSTPIYSYQFQNDSNPRWRAVVTFWPEHERYLRVLFKETPVHTVPAPVDLDYWSPGDRNAYDFHGKRGDVNIVIADPKRADCDAFEPLMAFASCMDDMPDGVRLHWFGAPTDLRGYAPIVRRIQDAGKMGIVHRWSKRLRDVYRAADMVITGNDIATRTLREATACGCPVNYVGGSWMHFNVPADESDRYVTREYAKSKFDPRQTAAAFDEMLTRTIRD